MIVVTGALGFIGSAFIAHLNKKGIDRVVACDRFRTGNKWLNIRALRYKEFVYPELLLEYLKNSKEAIDAVVHLGACSSTVEEDMDYLYNENYHFSRTLLDFCQNRNVSFIYASSAATYGDGEKGFSDEIDIRELRPLNKYGYSKQMFDLRVSRKKKSAKVIGLKFFNVFGPNEYHKGRMASVLYHAYRQYLETGKVTLFKSHRPDYAHGEQRRDFVYVKDVCEAIYRFTTATVSSGFYNVGSSKARTFNDLVMPIFEAFGVEPHIHYVDMPEEMQPRYQYFTQASMEKTQKAIGIDFFTPLEESTRDYVFNYLKPGYKYLES